MAVHLQGVPAEGLPLVGDGLDAHNLSGMAVNLETVAVEDGHQVVEAVVGRSHGRLPDLAFLHFAIPQQGVNPAGVAIQAGRQGCLLYTSDAADDLTRVDL